MCLIILENDLYEYLPDNNKTKTEARTNCPKKLKLRSSIERYLELKNKK